MIRGLRNSQQSPYKSVAHAIEDAPAKWEKGYCDLCCLLLSKAFMLGCGHTFCDRCIMVLVEGNKSLPPDTMECPFCLAISPYLTSLDSKISPELPALIPVTCQAVSHKDTKNNTVQYFCVQTGELICTFCASSALYTGKALLTITEAAEHFGNTIHSKTNTIRLAVAEVRKHVWRLRRQQHSLDLQLEEAIGNLNNRKAEIISAVTEKFVTLERVLTQLADVHREGLTREINGLTQQVQLVMEAVSSSEKHVAQQEPLSFLAEAKRLVSLLSRRLGALSGCTGRPALPPPELPRLGSTAGVVGAVRALDLRQ
ncbi:Hypothetical protein GLP15_1162 [Giardia lamblia P15]|uniref:RING-type domain-containing protein n=1 Tax=Giardia intestinalis (strain P15) TaxID=658858 RepID=E1F4P9_GIAIA|nr:Hypothetical protein GLP15_1162 [Giardia lamblia P15]